MAPSSSDEGQYLISLVVPEPKRAKKSQPAPPPLQIIPVKTEVSKVRDVQKAKEAPNRKQPSSTAGEEILQPAEAMVEREAMAMFRDDGHVKRWRGSNQRATLRVP